MGHWQGRSSLLWLSIADGGNSLALPVVGFGGWRKRLKSEMKTLRLKILAWLQMGCEHPSHAVKADILEGDLLNRRVQWCEICGAHRFAFWRHTGVGMGDYFPSEWRTPRPDWYTPQQRKQYLSDLAASK